MDPTKFTPPPACLRSISRNAARTRRTASGVFITTASAADNARRITTAYEQYNQAKILRGPLQGVYLSFFLMITLHFIAMYIFMYAMVNVLDNVFNSFNQVYMAALMTTSNGAWRFSIRRDANASSLFVTITSG